MFTLNPPLFFGEWLPAIHETFLDFNGTISQQCWQLKSHGSPWVPGAQLEVGVSVCLSLK